LVRLFYAPLVIYGGVYLLIFWVFAASLFGISGSVSWVYYFYLMICYILGYGILWGLAWAADRWGPAYKNEIFILVLMPSTFWMFALVPALILKALIQVFTKIF